jgi:hypothetical protein
MIVLFATEAFFLRRGDQHAVANQRRSRVVVMTGDTEDIHSEEEGSFGL